MGYPNTVIPEKIFFKIGEVCDLVGVQAHVLRYWETEFPMLSPQKNRSGQRTYRRRDVEIALRIKELLYDELFTIAGAKKKLQTDLRESARIKLVPPVDKPSQEQTVVENQIKPVYVSTPVRTVDAEPAEEMFDQPEEINQEIPAEKFQAEKPVMMNTERRDALKSLASQLLELNHILRASKQEDDKFKLRKY